MKKFFLLFLIVSFVAATNAMAGEGTLLKILLQKGVITESEYWAALKEEAAGVAEWTKRLTISGAVEGTLSWQEKRDDERYGDSTSEAVVDTVELGIEAAIADWITGGAVLLAEDLGSGGETSLDVDEAVITLQKESLPLYLVAGKRVVPFGFFPENFITDPMGKDAYETNEAGLTIGFTGPMDLDLSATIYRGEEMMGHHFESGLFSTNGIQRATDAVGANETDNLESYVLAASIAPMGDRLVLGASYLSEPGHSDRNSAAAFSLTSTPVERVTMNLEYFVATGREKYYTAAPARYADSFKEKVRFADLVFQVTDSVSMAAKYAHFDDDGMAHKSGTWSVQDRYSLAAFWKFYEKGNLNAFTGFEWRHSEHEVDRAVSANIADSNNELFVKLGIGF